MNTNLQTSMDPFECEVKKTYILRQYQNDGIHKINEKWDEGIRSILFQSPSGTGKTVLFSEIARQCYTNDRKILIVVHRKELVEQAKDKLFNNGVDAGIIMAGVLQRLCQICPNNKYSNTNE
ncbi:MAG: DEAD/DEAH box helicase family protein [Saprospiraceae bacterium]|nr:DEAD/DEAH box helicase family protein [Saprospiraceae bacterium]